MSTRLQNQQKRAPVNPNQGQRSKLYEKLVKSHLMICIPAVGIIAVAIGLHLLIQQNLNNLVNSAIPFTDTSSRILTDVHRSLASLRGWILLKNDEMIVQRKDAWNGLTASMAVLIELQENDETNIVDSETLHLLNEQLIKLKRSQWLIEDIAWTPGNEPAKVLFTERVDDIADDLLAGIGEIILRESESPERTEGKVILKYFADLRSNLSLGMEQLGRFIDTGDTRFEVSFQSKLKTAENIFAAIDRKKDLLSDDQRELLTWSESEFKLFRKHAADAINLRLTDEWNVARHLLATEAVPISRQIITLVNGISQRYQASLNSNSQRMTRLASLAITINAVLIIVMALVGFIGARRLSRSLIQPINQLTGATSEIIAGNLTTDIPVVSDDEIGVLTNSFNRMNSTLRSARNRLEQRAEELADANRKMAAEINERKRIESQLVEAKLEAEKANRTKSEFLASMSHELRTPMNAIIGYSEILVDQIPGPLNTKQLRYVNHVMASGHHLLNLINDVLDLSKIEAGKMEIYPVRFDVAEFLQETVSTIKPAAARKHIKVEENFQNSIGSIKADPQRLKQVMYNLLSNAVKFTPEAGSIAITAKRVDGKQGNRGQTSSFKFSEPGKVKTGGLTPISPPISPSESKFIITVKDSGIGVAPEDIDRVFGKFQQIDSTHAREQQGTGLGLTITKSFIELHGGKIWLESEGEGRGSTFSIELPVAPLLSNAQLDSIGNLRDRTDLPPDMSQSDEEPRTVLVIEDDRRIWEFIETTLTARGYRTVFAANGEAGLQKAQECRPTAILLDMFMPVKDGWSVLAALKSLPDIRDIPVIIMSMTDETDLDYNANVIEWIVKPVDRIELLGALQKCVNRTATKVETILLIDDDPKCAEIISKNLIVEGYKTLVGYSGLEGLEIAERIRPDLIVLDLMMPDMDGFEVMERLNANPDTKNIPIVINTAKDLTKDDQKRLQGKIENIFSKSNCMNLTDMFRKNVGKTG